MNASSSSASAFTPSPSSSSSCSSSSSSSSSPSSNASVLLPPSDQSSSSAASAPPAPWQCIGPEDSIVVQWYTEKDIHFKVLTSPRSPGERLSLLGVKMKRESFNGKPFDVWYRVDKKDGLIMLRENPHELDFNVEGSGQDNRSVVASPRNQKLDCESINTMKRRGEGETIIQALIDNHQSFSKKTKFAQEKYVKRKRKRHVRAVYLCKVTPRTICTMMFHMSPTRIMFMRPDTLSRILTYSNIQQNSKVLVVDSMTGLVAGAVATQMGDQGSVLLTHVGHSNAAAHSLRVFSQQVQNRVHILPFNRLMEGIKPARVEVLDESTLPRSTRIIQRYALIHDLLPIAHLESEHYEALTPQLGAEQDLTAASGELKFFHREVSRLGGYFSRQRLRELTDRKALQLVQRGFDSLILATDGSVLQAVCLTWPTLLCGGQLVIYSQFLEDLGEVYTLLDSHEAAFRISISDALMREYKVLPSATRPAMKMPGCSGFILVATKIRSDHKIDYGLYERIMYASEQRGSDDVHYHLPLSPAELEALSAGFEPPYDHTETPSVSLTRHGPRSFAEYMSCRPSGLIQVPAEILASPLYAAGLESEDHRPVDQSDGVQNHSDSVEEAHDVNMDMGAAANADVEVDLEKLGTEDMDVEVEVEVDVVDELEQPPQQDKTGIDENEQIDVDADVDVDVDVDIELDLDMDVDVGSEAVDIDVVGEVDNESSWLASGGGAETQATGATEGGEEENLSDVDLDLISASVTDAHDTSASVDVAAELSGGGGGGVGSKRSIEHSAASVSASGLSADMSTGSADQVQLTKKSKCG
mmetsp:Transcript_7631/g.23489  ORF Transcript_7631/g.23489 Transcript_7631/m.23489 type:complete len:814 (-) Transcript_7631:94-2535(-)